MRSQILTAVCDWEQKLRDADDARDGGRRRDDPDGAQRGAPPVFRPVDFLKPTKLSIETSPDKVRDWKARFESFCKASHVDTQERKEQHEVLYALLDTDLTTRMMEEVDDTDSLTQCLAKLDLVFTAEYPLHTRRWKFMQIKQKKGEKWTAYEIRLRRASEEADLPNFTPDMFYKYMMMQGTTDKVLRDKFYALIDPPKESIMQEARGYEQSQASQSHAETARKSYEGRGRGRGGRGARGGRGGRGGQGNQDARDTDRCYRCAASGHISTDCKVPRDKLYCKICDLEGSHKTQACRSKGKGKYDRSRSRDRSQDRRSSWKKKKEERRKKKKYRSRKTKQDSSTSEASSTDVSSSECTSDEDSSPPRSRSKSRHKNRKTTFKCKQTKFKCSYVQGGDDIPVWCDISNKLYSRSAKSFRHPACADTGCTKSVCPLQLLQRNQMKYEKRNDLELASATGQDMKVEGLVKLYLKPVDGFTREVECLVSSEAEDFLIATDDLKALGIIHPDFPAVVYKRNKARKVTMSDNGKQLEKLKAKYPQVFSNKLAEGKSMKGGKMDIDLKPGSRPYKVSGTRPIPLAMQPKANALIQELIDSKVIRRISHTTEWCAPGHFVDKADKSKARLVTDFSVLNKSIDRPVHPFLSPEQVMNQIKPESKFFCALDMTHGYYQLDLTKRASDLLTFLLPDGRYQYLKGAQGCCSTGDIFCERTDEAFRRIEGLLKEVDDVLLQAATEEELYKKLEEVVKRCAEWNITLSSKKIQMGSSVKFAGFIVTDKGVLPDPARLSALASFKSPTNITELRSFLGLMNTISSYHPDLAQLTARMRELLKKQNTFLWLDDHEIEFNKVKDAIAKTQALSAFDPNLDTVLLTDASRLHGLGFLLLQLRPDGSYSIIRCGSVTLTDTQRRYAVCELESLGIFWAIKKCRFWLRGLHNFVVWTDHKPLTSCFTKDLRDIENQRIATLREKLTDFTFDVKWVPGKKHEAADALSRRPEFKTMEEEEDEQCRDPLKRISLCRRTYSSHKKARKDPQMRIFIDAIDPEYRQVLRAFRDNADVKKLQSTHPARAYSTVWSKLSLMDSCEDTLLILDDKRICVPPGARQEVLSQLHTAHQGIGKTRGAARERYFWPNMNLHVQNMVESCEMCREHLPSQDYEPARTDRPKVSSLTPMQEVGIDLAEYGGKTYLCLCDRYSGYVLYHHLRNTTTTDVTDKLEEWCDQFGHFRVARTDGGPQFRGKFDRWCKEQNVIHELSSAYSPESNGLAESAIRRTKSVIKKCKKDKKSLRVGIAHMNNTPRSGESLGPSEMFYQREVRTSLPGLKRKIGPAEIKEHEKKRQKTLEKTRDLSSQKRKYPKFKVGDQVWIQGSKDKLWNTHAKVTKIRDGHHSYILETDEGKRKLRNRRFLKPDRAHTGPASSAGYNTTNVQAQAAQASSAEHVITAEDTAERAPRRSSRLQNKRAKAQGVSVHFGVEDAYHIFNPKRPVSP